MKRDLVIHAISEVTFTKLQKLKDDQGFGEKDWGEWLTHLARDVHLQDTQSEAIQRHTRDGLLELWVQNLAKNLSKIWNGNTIASIVPDEVKKAEAEGKDPDFSTGTAIVIGRGPSIFKNQHLELLAQSDYHGTIVCTDGALIDALTRGVQPDKYENFFTVTVDGNREKIWKWFDHELVDKYGKYIKAILCSSVADNVPERCEKAGIQVHWFHPLFDDYRNIESYTKIQQYMTQCEKHPNGVPAMQAGGNAGATAWVLSWVVLRKTPVALIGIDLGYLPETPLESTYYWQGLLQATGGNPILIQQAYEKVFNPGFNTEAIIDPVFKHYREAFRDLTDHAPKWMETWNCTEGGSLFGESIICKPFRDFLAEFKR